MTADLFSDFQQDHFALFGLPRRFALDGAELDTLWRTAAAQVHPDRFASAGDAEKRVALMAATRVNEAYQTLKSPLARARRRDGKATCTTCGNPACACPRAPPTP